MKNCPAIYQVFFLDCCRTSADGLLDNADSPGSQIIRLSPTLKTHSYPTQQCVFMAALEGERACARPQSVSVFTDALLAALALVAADEEQPGAWRTTTDAILGKVRRILDFDLSAEEARRSMINTLAAATFDFNDVILPSTARVYLGFSDRSNWDSVTLHCKRDTEAITIAPDPLRQGQLFRVLDLAPGAWTFSGERASPNGVVTTKTLVVKHPAVFLTLEFDPAPVVGGLLGRVLGATPMGELLGGLLGPTPRGGGLGGLLGPTLSLRKENAELRRAAVPESDIAWFALRAFGSKRVKRVSPAPAAYDGPEIVFGDLIPAETDGHVGQPRTWLAPAPQDGTAGAGRWLAVSRGDGRVALVSAPMRPHDPGRIEIAILVATPAGRDAGGKVGVSVEDPAWAALNRAVVPRGSSLAPARPGETVSDAVILETLRRQADNPIAAAAAAIVAIDRCRSASEQAWDPLLERLADGFAEMPDGAALLGCRRLQRASGDPADLDAARARLLAAYRRGIPYYSSTIQRLASALAQFPEEDAETESARKMIVGVSTFVDREQAFTVLNFGKSNDAN